MPKKRFNRKATRSASVVSVKPARGSRTLKKGENLQLYDRCFICGGLADLVTRCGSRYRPLCLDCTPSKNATFARSVELMLSTGAETQRAQLISNILYDLGNETGVFATHPKLIRVYTMLMLEVLPALEWRERKIAEQSFSDVRELLSGCSTRRLNQIDRRHNEPVRASAVESSETQKRAKLREDLADLQPLPENEGIRLQLESEIYRSEHTSKTDEWPDVIGGGDGN